MYLAHLHHGTTSCYQLRRSYPVGESRFTCRLVYDLGSTPADHFEVVDDCIVLYSPKLLKAVHDHHGEENLLDELLNQFFPAQTRRHRDRWFRRRPSSGGGPLAPGEDREISSQVHLFDLRRLYYLRYGAVDQSRLSRLHPKCCRPLLGQSRDEREFYFAAEEACLSPGHYLQYVYAIFNIQQHFAQSFAPWFPEALAHDEMADHLEDALCRLHADPRFWQGEAPAGPLHPHLIRYLIMFTDFTPQPRSFAADFRAAFQASHRSFRWPEKSRTPSPEKISAVFGISSAILEKMPREELTRLYRRRAMELHPDRGGDHHLFIELTEIYQGLRRR